MTITERTTDFDDWIAEVFGRIGPFTMLIVLFAVDDRTVTPVASSYLHVLGDETRWADMPNMFAAAETGWNAAAFFQGDRDGLVDDATARWRLSSLARHLKKDPLLVNRGEFFNAQGLRLKLEEGAGE